jgi:hypothetical protein
MTDTTLDPSNFTRVTLALERWIKTGEILATCLEKSGDTANFQRVRAIQSHVQKLQETISQLRG